jgi:L-rhamnose isomerase
MPAGAVWDYHCLSQNVPQEKAWLDEVRNHEKKVLTKRV